MSTAIIPNGNNAALSVLQDSMSQIGAFATLVVFSQCKRSLARRVI